MDLTTILTKLGIAVGLGLLVGLQRERALASKTIAGIRTFPLITLLGTLCGLLAEGRSAGGFIIAAGVLGVAALVVVGNLIELRSGSTDPGITTEVAAVLMFAIGAYLADGHYAVAIALGGSVAVLLQAKASLHALVAKIGEQDLRAIMRFALIALVILPILPNETYGPYHVLNPRKIWLMVVLIVGISLCGYVAVKLVGARAGTALSGLLGGMVSSTATTVSYARLSRQDAGAAAPGAMAVMIASTVLYARVMVLIAIVAPAILSAVAAPLGIMLAATVILSLFAYLQTRRQSAPMIPTQNPAELKFALIFAALFALVLLATAFARDKLGSQGLYGVAVLSGLTDMDAITLSTAGTGNIPPQIIWRVILVASLSNLVFKTGVAAVMGSRAFLWRLASVFAVTMAVGVALFLWWPG